MHSKYIFLKLFSFLILPLRFFWKSKMLISVTFVQINFKRINFLCIVFFFIEIYIFLSNVLLNIYINIVTNKAIFGFITTLKITLLEKHIKWVISGRIHELSVVELVWIFFFFSINISSFFDNFNKVYCKLDYIYYFFSFFSL